jgi:hypothetical protein
VNTPPAKAERMALTLYVLKRERRNHELADCLLFFNMKKKIFFAEAAAA